MKLSPNKVAKSFLANAPEIDIEKSYLKPWPEPLRDSLREGTPVVAKVSEFYLSGQIKRYVPGEEPGYVVDTSESLVSTKLEETYLQ